MKNIYTIFFVFIERDVFFYIINLKYLQFYLVYKQRLQMLRIGMQ